MNRLLIPLIPAILAVSLHPFPLGSRPRAQKEKPKPSQSDETPCWQKASTQWAMNECAGLDLKRADAELNETYWRVLAKYSGDQQRIAQIKKAEAAWLAFRDAEIEALFPESSRSERGSVYTMCRLLRMARLTTERAKVLKAVLEHQEDDVCVPQ